MNKVHLLFSGPIRPNIECVKYVYNKYNTQFKEFDNLNIITYLSTWKTDNISEEELKMLFEHVVIEDEASNEYIYSIITERTIQQRQNRDLESWTLGLYKQFQGIKNLIKYINNKNLIQNNEIVLRIRLDMVFEVDKIIWEQMFNTLHVRSNIYYVNFLTGCGNYSDWFGVTTYENLKKIWYFNGLHEFNTYIKNSYNVEYIVKNRATANKIISINIKTLSSNKPNNYLVRHYVDEENHKKHYYE